MKRINKFKTYALVTGAASGMGRIYARRLALLGYSLVIVDINEKGLHETETLVMEEVAASDAFQDEEKGEFRVLAVQQDLSLPDAADSIYARTEETGCQVEVLVNNAGVMYCQGIAETSERMLSIG